MKPRCDHQPDPLHVTKSDLQRILAEQGLGIVTPEVRTEGVWEPTKSRMVCNIQVINQELK